MKNAWTGVHQWDDGSGILLSNPSDIWLTLRRFIELSVKYSGKQPSTNESEKLL
jgi:hypothetical protein